ncbi:MAG: hypothetical protein H6721_07355 [Sandaracinus sp.]|nr:hypothetical protein [Myxococcales bacterium]MCB9603027.1 hypothetical protein [Sandaracinus sp.]MCB9616441.1 hypothetical protein [Sandaracinus sp.]MCB9620037.1 hypothetical protein [Sandaracinus sp.]MCB9631937.1 hypothetical protein [Sandaracinus sp.]
MIEHVLERVTRIRRGLARRVRGLAYALFGAGVALGAVVASVDDALAETLRRALGQPVGAVATALLVVGTIILPFVKPSSEKSRVALPGPLAAREKGATVELTLKGKVHRIPAGEFVSGHVVPAHSYVANEGQTVRVETHVLLERRGGDGWELQVASVEEGLELLAAVGLGARDRTLNVTRRRSGTMIATVPLTLLASPLTMLPIALAKLALPDYALGYLVLVIWITTGRWILNRLQPSPLRVGADGLAWKEGRQTRFVAHRDIEDACFEPASKFWGGFRLVLKTTSGEVPIELGPVGPAVAETTVAHVLAARGQARATTQTLARGGRDFDAWKDDLARAMSADYRKAGVPKVRVLETLEDPHAPADQRLGAAMALAAEEPEAAQRLAREAAKACADPRLAEALEAFADARLDAKRAEAVVGE